MMSNKTFMLSCPIITAIMIGLILSMIVSAVADLWLSIDPVILTNGMMLSMFFVVPMIGAIAKALIYRKYAKYIPESKNWVYDFKQEIYDLDFEPKFKNVSWSELEAAVPKKYTERYRVYALLLLIDDLRGKIPSKGVPAEAREFINKHYNVYIGLLLH
uniref:Membrane protein n=1 Tax=Pantoea phage Survivor TaxID=3232176 RepID=A0AAU8L0M9_9CAUD